MADLSHLNKKTMEIPFKGLAVFRSMWIHSLKLTYPLKPQKWWLRDYFPLGKACFQGYVSFREGTYPFRFQPQKKCLRKSPFCCPLLRWRSPTSLAFVSTGPWANMATFFAGLH